MTKLIASGAVQADADVCNAVVPPTKGCAAGGGIQILIPSDWQIRVTLGQDVPGCTYARIDPSGAIYVDDRTQLRLATPAVVNALTPAQQTQAAALNIKLATAQILAAQMETLP